MADSSEDELRADLNKRRAKWKPGIEPISLGGLSLLGLDKEKRLYWDGEPIRTDTRLDLTWVQTAIAIAAALGALASGVSAVAEVFFLKS